jgi:predicted GNAT superfamily acetyltransferase
VRWTFDPVIARNAYFNLVKLGAVADRFERAFYGEMADDLNRGDRTDRLTARWNLDLEPGPRRVPAATTFLRRNGDGPAVVASSSDADAVAVEVPVDYHDLRTADPDVAARWRDAVADAAETCFARGLVAVAFDRERSAYVFAHEAG